uniref:CUB domain-containing protein n=1 Tax=Schizaphis graminum TaxID=13262 RepID=A0A2S2P7N4_SCHGA
MFKIFATATCLTALALAVIGQADYHDDERQGRGWNMLEGAKRSCVGMHGRPGICMGQSECSEANGKSVGRCFPFDACCSVTPNSCGGFSSSSTTYFQSPEKFQDVCSYKINVRRNVCQLRIDFERFSLGQPTKQTSESAYTCERDEFTLISNGDTKINVPVLCGENSGQHVYVPVNQQQYDPKNNNKQQITLRFRLTARDEDYTDPEPFWKLKISQLECQTTSTNWWKIKDIARQVWDWEDEERDATRFKYSLAPEGCLQYFTDKHGSFESFNYNKGMGHYLGNLNYATCFRRDQDTCGIKYEAVKFQVAYNQRLTSSTDRDCDTVLAGESEQSTTQTPGQTTLTSGTTKATTKTTQLSTETTQLSTETTQSSSSTEKTPNERSSKKRSSERGDYLLIPDGLYSSSRFASKYCDKSLENVDDSTVKTQGPLYVAFVSDDYSNPNEDVEKGYKINYSLTNTGC